MDGSSPHTPSSGVSADGPRRPMEFDGFRKVVFETKAPLVVNDDRRDGNVDLGRRRAPFSRRTGQVGRVRTAHQRATTSRGASSLQNIDSTDAFTEADVRLLTTLAGSLSVALENARLFDETQRLLTETNERAAELAIINSVQEGLAAKLDMQSMYDLVGDKIQEIFDAQVVDIALFDFDADLIHYPYAIERGVRLPRSAGAKSSQQVSTSESSIRGNPFWSNDVEADSVPKPGNGCRRRKASQPSHSYMCR